MSLPEINLPVYAVDATSSYLLKGRDGPPVPDDRLHWESYRSAGSLGIALYFLKAGGSNGRPGHSYT